MSDNHLAVAYHLVVHHITFLYGIDNLAFLRLVVGRECGDRFVIFSIEIGVLRLNCLYSFLLKIFDKFVVKMELNSKII